jgi:hypothetical protein
MLARLAKLARQMLYLLNNSTSPVLCWVFQDRVSWTIYLRLASNCSPPDLFLLRITGTSHWHLAKYAYYS